MSISTNLDQIEVFPWNDHFNTGITRIDEQHKVLVTLLNRLANAQVVGNEVDLHAAFDALADYANHHFHDEEEVWVAYFLDDPWLASHQMNHASFLPSVVQIKNQTSGKSLSDIIEQIVRFLIRWLAFHIIDEDKRMVFAIEALESGASMDEAKHKADQQMSGSMRILIDAILQMYDQLSTKAIGLMRERRARNRAEQQLKEAERAKDEFLASMSHELRTPLTVIIGNSGILSDTHLNAKQRNLIRSIEVSGRLQLALVNDLLDLSKIESGKFEINKGLFDLESLINDLQLIFSAQSGSEKVRFRVEQNVHFGTMLVGDGQRISQVLINLLSNAFKFTEQGEIVLTVRQESDQLTMSVSDQGIGMAPDVVERLFIPFEQADRSIADRFGGTGLGLHISRTLAKLMGGTISVESKEGEGSIFQFAVPLIESDRPVSPGKIQQLSGHSCFRGDLLVAEDIPSIQDLQRELLEDMGLTVTFANNGREAVEQVAEHSFDLILIDMQMPVMDGIEATQKIRASGVTTPIIAVTANVMQKHRDAFSEVGGSDFLEKPIEKEELTRLLACYFKTSLESPHLMSDQDQGNRTVIQKEDGEITEMVAAMLHDFGNHITSLRPYYTELIKARDQGKQLSQGLLEQQKKIDSAEEAALTFRDVGEAMGQYVESYLGENLDSTNQTLESMVNRLRDYREKIRHLAQQDSGRE